MRLTFSPNKLHAFFRDKTVAVLAKVIHRTAGLEYLKRLMAIRAARFEGNIVIAAVAVRDTVLRLERCVAIRTGYRHALSC